MRLVDSLHQNRREVLATELAQARRDLELEVTGTLARAAAQAQDLRDGADREARAARAAADAEVEHLKRRRDELVAEIVELSAGCWLSSRGSAPPIPGPTTTAEHRASRPGVGWATTSSSSREVLPAVPKVVTPERGRSRAHPRWRPAARHPPSRCRRRARR